MTDPGSLSHRKMGLDAFARKDFPAAAHWLRLRATAAPHDIEAHCKLSWALSQCGRHAEAIATIESTVAMRPAQAEVHYYHGMVLCRAGRLLDAAGALNQALRLQPGHAEARAWLGWIDGELRKGAAGAPPGTQSRRPPPSPLQVVFSLPYLSAILVRMALPTALLGLLFAGFLVVYGWQSMLRERELKTPTVLTGDEFLRLKPSRGWFQLKGCTLVVAGSVWEYYKKSGEITTAYVPIMGPETINDEVAHAVLRTTDPAILEQVRAIDSYIRQHGEAALFELIRQNPAVYDMERDVEGVVETGRLGNDATIRKLVEGSSELAPDLTILRDGPPQWGEGAAAIRTGFALGLGIIALLTIPTSIWVWGLIRQIRTHP